MNTLAIILSNVSFVFKIVSLFFIIKRKLQNYLWICWVIISLDVIRIPLYIFNSNPISAILSASSAFCWIILYIMYKKN